MNKIKLSILVLGIVFILIWISSPIEYLLSFTNDDSYFYLKTALNFAKQGKSTFDGISLTNGYHPLWFLILTVVFKLSLLSGVSSENLLLRIVFLLVTFLNIIILYLIKKAFFEFEINHKNKAFLLSLVLLIPFVLFYQLGLETQIFTLFFFIVITQVSRFFINPDNVKLKIGISISLSLLFLSRVDLFWYILTMLLIYILLKDRNLFHEFLKILSLPFVTIFVYVLINKMVFNTYYPISSYYKLSFNIFENLKFFPTPLKNPIDFSILFLIIVLKLSSIFFLNKSRCHKNDFVKILIWSNFTFIFFLLINFLINSNGVREWYYTFPMFTSIMCFSLVISTQRIYNIILLASFVINLFYFTIFRMNYYNHTSAYNYALDLKKSIKEDSIIYQVDYSGLISFFSGKSIINGDGLINSYEYYEYVKSGRLKEYLENYKPEYLSFYSFENPFVNEKITHKFKVIKEYQLLIPAKNLVLRRPFLYGGIFRRKFGNFYLVKFNEFQIITN